MDFLPILLLNSVIGLWMYNHAKNKKLENPSTWFWIALIFGVFGLVTYLYWHGGTKQNSTPKKSAK